MTQPHTVEVRARKSAGISDDAVLVMVRRTLERRKISGDCLVDVGCGAGNLYPYVQDRFQRYVGVDVVRYEGFPSAAEFVQVDLDQTESPFPEGRADVVAAVEVIEHLENPRAFMRKLVQLARPRGTVLVTTPNQLSLMNLATLAIKGRFHAFQDVHYPAHLTALLPIDLIRIATECGLEDLEIEYSRSSRMPLTTRRWPNFMAQSFPRQLSENVLVIGTKPSEAAAEPLSSTR